VCEELYGAVTGKICISDSTRDCKEELLNIMESGDTFGEIALLDQSTCCSFSASAFAGRAAGLKAPRYW
jgi:CRP-like cAMP-binding protein